MFQPTAVTQILKVHLMLAVHAYNLGLMKKPILYQGLHISLYFGNPFLH